MGFLSQDLFVAASMAAHSFKAKEALEIGDLTKEKLWKELLVAEKLYDGLKRKVSRKKIKSIRLKIDSLKAVLEGQELISELGSVKEEPNILVDADDFIEHEGEIITPPVLEDIYHDLYSFDEEFSVAEKKEESFNEPEPRLSLLLFDLPPPPPKGSE